VAHDRGARPRGCPKPTGTVEPAETPIAADVDRRRISILPVVDAKGALVRIVALDDMLLHLVTPLVAVADPAARERRFEPVRGRETCRLGHDRWKTGPHLESVPRHECAHEWKYDISNGIADVASAVALKD
jgi:hypothetical protein